jgi:hypothetical protein
VVSGYLHASAALPPIPIGYEAGWAGEPVWTLWRREKSCPYREITPTVQPVAVPTEQNRDQVYTVVILPLVLDGWETWSVTLREQRLGVFENRVLRGMWAQKGEGTAGMRSVRWAWHKARMIFGVKSEGTIPLRGTRSRWEDDI